MTGGRAITGEFGVEGRLISDRPRIKLTGGCTITGVVGVEGRLISDRPRIKLTGGRGALTGVVGVLLQLTLVKSG